MQIDKQISPTTQATIATLATLFPRAFAVAEHERRPLKVNVFNDLIIATANVIEPDALRSALAFYTSAGGYLRSCVKGTPRIDLDGDAAGFVTAGQAAWVAGILRRRRKADAAATTSATPPRTRRTEATFARRSARCRPGPPGGCRMSERERLPNRRASETFNLEHAAMKYTVTISRFADGRVGEAFIAKS